VLDFEEGLDELIGNEAKISSRQQAAIKALDQLIIAMSGKDNTAFWVEDSSLQSDPQWEKIRHRARECLATFGWESDPPPSQAFYISGRE
jgi:hypothetical protein